MACVKLFGLSIESDLPLPGPATSETPDVTVSSRLARNYETFADYETTVRNDGTIEIEHDGIAFRISSGNRIDVVYPSTVDQGLVTAWLTGVAFGALLLQRGLFPIHANAVVLPGNTGVAVFAGPSGAGKSTLAARFVAAGYDLFCDDLLAVGFDAVAPIAIAGIPRLRLWQDTIDHLGLNNSSPRQIIAAADKFEIGLKTGKFCKHELPLQRFYVLESGDDVAWPSIDRLTGAEAGTAVLDNAYRWRISVGLNGSGWAFERSLQIARSAEGYRFSRPWSLAREAETFDLIDRHLRA